LTLKLILNVYFPVRIRCDWLQISRLLFFVCTWAVVTGSFAAVFSWWMIEGLHSTWFEGLYQYGTGEISFLPASVSVLGAYAAAAYFFTTEVSAGNRALEENGW
jgi:hypothetical protein